MLAVMMMGSWILVSYSLDLGIKQPGNMIGNQSDASFRATSSGLAKSLEFIVCVIQIHGIKHLVHVLRFHFAV